MSFVLRPATISDADQILAWRNDPWILANSATKEVVTPEAHVKWLINSLASNHHLIYIIEAPEGVGMGVLRFRRQDDASADISIYLLKSFTGKGIGVPAICEGCRLAFGHWSHIRTIRAYILTSNEPSLKAFTKAGFYPSIETVSQGLTLFEKTRV